jgi:hypothetical protein
MAVVHIKEVTGRDGERDMPSNVRYVRVFQLLTDDPTTGAKEVRDHPLLPEYGDPWEVYKLGVLIDTDLDARCVEKVAVQTDGENHQNWTVTCRYVGVGDPTLEPPKVNWTSEKWQETSNRDFNGTLVANSAGEPFESGLTRDRTRGVIIIERNVLTWDPLLIEEYRDTTNLFPYLAARHPPGFPTGTCKLESSDATAVFYPNYPDTTDVHYYRRTDKVVIDRNTWNAVMLDQGFKELLAAGGVDKLFEITDEHGQRIATPALLDGTGLQKAAGDPPVYLPPFVRYELKDWTDVVLEY